MSTTEVPTAVREFEIGFDDSEIAEMRRAPIGPGLMGASCAGR